MHVIHSLPFVTVLVNVIISKANFIPSHCIYAMIEGIAYSVVNYLGTMYRQHILYPFMKWEDYTTVVICFFLVIFGGILFNITCFGVAKGREYIDINKQVEVGRKEKDQ